MQTLDHVDAANLKTDIPAFRVGDNVKVHVNIIEGNRSRVQVFQGVVIRRSGDGIRETFTVRKVSFQVGVERTFPIHSPVIDKIELVSRGAVRRAKLYYLRDLRGKAAKIKERRGANNEFIVEDVIVEEVVETVIEQEVVAEVAAPEAVVETPAVVEETVAETVEAPATDAAPEAEQA